MLVAGLPRNFAIALLTMTLAIAFGFGQIWFFGVAVCMFVAGAFLTKFDQYFFEISLVIIKLPEEAD